MAAEVESLVGAGVRGGSRIAALWRAGRNAARRLGWGIVDQGASSLTNFAVTLYVARTLGATQFGAFSLAYVTYSFVLNASRGLSTDPLMVRFSGTNMYSWRRAVGRCTGTALIVGLAGAAGVFVATAFLHGTARMAFLALGLTLPGLMLQDSWRYAFFALGRGSQAFLNDMVWLMALIPGLILLRENGSANVFWFILCWGAAGAVGAAVGPLQARVLPKPLKAWEWIRRHRDLGPRYFAENTSNGGATQLRTYGIGLILGLAAVGYVQAAQTLMGPFLVIFMGISLVTVPEAGRILRRSPRHLWLFCLLVGAGLALAGFLWGMALLIALPEGLGQLALKGLWQPTYPLILPLTISVIGACFTAGAAAGLHALGAAPRSLRAMVVSSILFLGCGLEGAALGGPVGAMRGAAVATCIGALVWWWHLLAALEEHEHPLPASAPPAGPSGQ
jgi:O-antigen/teichoic acid export membrane protein